MVVDLIHRNETKNKFRIHIFGCNGKHFFRFFLFFEIMVKMKVWARLYTQGSFIIHGVRWKRAIWKPEVSQC